MSRDVQLCLHSPQCGLAVVCRFLCPENSNANYADLEMFLKSISIEVEKNKEEIDKLPEVVVHISLRQGGKLVVSFTFHVTYFVLLCKENTLSENIPREQCFQKTQGMGDTLSERRKGSTRNCSI